jgi:hypothetical protein
VASRGDLRALEKSIALWQGRPVTLAVARRENVPTTMASAPDQSAVLATIPAQRGAADPLQPTAAGHSASEPDTAAQPAAAPAPDPGLEATPAGTESGANAGPSVAALVPEPTPTDAQSKANAPQSPAGSFRRMRSAYQQSRSVVVDTAGTGVAWASLLSGVVLHGSPQTVMVSAGGALLSIFGARIATRIGREKSSP